VNVTTIQHADHQFLRGARRGDPVFMRRASLHRYLTLALSALLLTGCQPPGPKALLEGDRLIAEGKYVEAIPKLRRAADLLPGNPMAWNFLALAYHHAGQPDEALAAYQQAVALDRNSPAIRFNLGVLHLEQGRIAEAISELTTCTVLDQNSPAAWLHLGKAHLLRKSIDEAQKALETARKLEPKNPETLNYLGVVELHRRRTRDAISFFNAALQEQPDFAPAVLNQAIFYHYYVVNKTNALQKYRDYLGLEPDEAGFARASEAVKQLELETTPRPLPTVVTNRSVATVTNAPAAPTNVFVARLVQTNRPVALVTNKPPATVAASAPTNIVATNKPVAVIPNRVAEPTNPPLTVVVKADPPKQDAPAKKIEEPKPEPPPKLEVVKIEDEAPIIVPARDPAPEPKPATPPPVVAAETNKPVQVAIAKPAEPERKKDDKPLIRPVQPEEKSKIAQRLEKLNPTSWFRRGDKKEKETELAKAPETKAEAPSKASALEFLPEPPPKKSSPNRSFRLDHAIRIALLQRRPLANATSLKLRSTKASNIIKPVALALRWMPINAPFAPIRHSSKRSSILGSPRISPEICRSP
jgi:Flp pilus assembly protein TadD